MQAVTQCGHVEAGVPRVLRLAVSWICVGCAASLWVAVIFGSVLGGLKGNDDLALVAAATVLAGVAVVGVRRPTRVGVWLVVAGFGALVALAFSGYALGIEGFSVSRGGVARAVNPTVAFAVLIVVAVVAGQGAAWLARRGGCSCG